MRGAIVDRGVISTYSQPVARRLRMLMYIPSCHRSRAWREHIPVIEQQIIGELCAIFTIPYKTPMTYQTAEEYKGAVLKVVGEKFDQYSELVQRSRFEDKMETEVMSELGITEGVDDEEDA